MDYKVQSVIFLKSKWTETTASDWLLENSYKIKKEDVTEKYLRFRQINPDYLKRVGYTHFVNKDIGKGIHLIIAYKKQQGGAVSASNVKRFVEASYKKKADENINDYILDKSLSNDYAKTYYNPKTNQAVVVHRGTSGASDWLNNVAYASGLYNFTNRYKTGKKIQDKASKKYGKENISTLGHSQGSVLSRKLGQDSKEIINLNPAYMGEAPTKKEYNIRSSTDLVSGLLAPVNILKGTLYPSYTKNHEITIQSENPVDVLTEHSPEILNRLDPEMMIGKGISKSEKKKLSYEIKPITEEKMRNSYLDLADEKTVPPETSLKGNDFVDYFTFLYRLNTVGKKRISFWDFWENKTFYMKKQYVKNMLKYYSKHTNMTLVDKLYKIFRVYFGSASIFKPVLAMNIYQRFKPTSVLDFTMGWGGRLVGASALNIPSYIGIDMNQKLEQPYKEMVKELKALGSTTKINLIFKDALAVDYSKLDYDCVFTSPPYYNTEIYDGSKRMTEEEWNENFYIPIFNETFKHLKMGGYYILNIPISVYENVCIGLFGNADEKIPMYNSRNLSKKLNQSEYKEYIYVWCKREKGGTRTPEQLSEKIRKRYEERKAKETPFIFSFDDLEEFEVELQATRAGLRMTGMTEPEVNEIIEGLRKKQEKMYMEFLLKKEEEEYKEPQKLTAEERMELYRQQFGSDSGESESDTEYQGGVIDIDDSDDEWFGAGTGASVSNNRRIRQIERLLRNLREDVDLINNFLDNPEMLNNQIDTNNPDFVEYFETLLEEKETEIEELEMELNDIYSHMGYELGAEAKEGGIMAYS